MHTVLLQGKTNFPSSRLFDAALAAGPLTVIADADADHRYDERVSVHRVADTRDAIAVRGVLMQIKRQRKVDQLVTLFERHQATGGYLRGILGLPGRDFATAVNLSSKLAMKRRYRSAGIPTSDFDVAFTLEEVKTIAGTLGWPIVVKPIMSSGCSNVVAFHDSAELEKFLASDSRAAAMAALDMPFIVERFVDMIDEYHCDGVVSDGTITFVSASRYLQPLLGCSDDRNGSTLLPSSDHDAQAIFELHARVVAALGMRDGVTHLELFKTESGFLAGEIAGRVAGGGIPEAILLRHGVDLWAVDFDLACGRRPRIEPRTSNDYVVNLLLPARPGIIRRISEANDFSGLPGVVRVDMTRRIGDTIPPEMHSSSSSGIVYLSLPDETAIEAAVKGVMERFRLSVEIPEA